MKKITMGLMLSLISIGTANACYIEPLGYCGDQSYFTTRDFNPNSVYYIKAQGSSDTLIVMTTGNTVYDSVFKLPVLPNVVIELRYKYLDSAEYVTGNEWWGQAPSANYEWEDCDVSILAISITDVVAMLKNGNLKVSFTSLDESQVMKYQIVGSTDGKEYNTLLKAIDPTGQGTYTTTIPMPYAAAGVGLGALLFLAVGVRNRKLFALMSLIAITFVFVSCSKEKKIELGTDLTKITSIRVVAVQTTGAQVFSDVKPIR